MIRALGVLILAIATLAAADASNYAVGYKLDGYTWTGSYWRWPDGRLYTRTTYPAYDSYGRYYLGVQYEEYKVPQPQALPAPLVYQLPDYKDPKWKDKVIDILAQREDYKQFRETILLTGLAESDGLSGLRPLVPGLRGGDHYSAYSRSSYYNTPSPTQYASNAFTYADIWGDSSPSLLFQQANQHVKASGTMFEAGMASAFTVVDKNYAHRERLAEIKAQSDAAIAFLQAVKTQSSHHEKVERRFGQPPQADPQPAPPPSPPRPSGKLDPVLFEKMAIHQCGACHLGEKVKGGFNLESMRDMTVAEKRDRVWARITHKDPGKRMPQAPDGGPGTPLTKQELDLWYLYLFVPQAALMPPVKDN